MEGRAKYRVLAISGSTRAESANLRMIRAVARMAEEVMDVEIYDDLATLPHFNPDLDNGHDLPEVVRMFRARLEQADGVLICTPEYVFSLPGSLKNAIEWVVSTTIFTDKPVATIVASSLGEKAHESLALILKTIQAKTTSLSSVLIQGARGRVDMDGNIADAETRGRLQGLIAAFGGLMAEK